MASHTEHIDLPVAWDEGRLWSFCRTLIEQGRAIQQDDAAGKYPTYEHLAARVDDAARERTAEFIARCSSPAASGPIEAAATEELGEWMRVVREAIWYARVTAHSHGYALAVHGSLRRDVDVVAVPWTDVTCSPDELAEKITTWLVQIGVSFEGAWGAAQKTREEKPHGRLAWSISLKGPLSLTSRGQCAPYLDLSILPPLHRALETKE